MSLELDLSLQYMQSRAFNTRATEVLYGGAAGGGKSHLIRVATIAWACEIGGLQVYLFRRLSDDLYKNHMTGPGSYTDLLAPLEEAKMAKWNGSKNFWDFWNGSRIWLCHCQYEKDVTKYQGAEIGVLCLDEGTHFTAPMYRYLRGRVRMGSVKMPPKYKGLFPRILIATNPGGVGHSFFKKEFIDLAPPMETTKMPKKEGGMLRQFIPAKLTDNPILLENDPDYADRLESLGDPALVRAMLEGDWNIVAGGALDDVWDQKIVLPRFPIPKGWKIDRAFDWGSTHPFSVGWWAVSNGEEITIGEDTLCLPKGSLVNFHEWYGAKDLHENAGLRIGPVEIAEGILEREYGLKKAGWVATDAMFKAGPADNQIFNVNDTESDSIGDKMKKTGVEWVLSDKKAGSRINGLQLLRERMRNVKDGRGTPGIYFMEHCRAAITTLPVLPRDKTNPEDVDTNSIDHAYDQIRYRVLHEAREYAKSINIQWSR